MRKTRSSIAVSVLKLGATRDDVRLTGYRQLLWCEGGAGQNRSVEGVWRKADADRLTCNQTEAAGANRPGSSC
jgi:hypothetical protein